MVKLAILALLTAFAACTLLDDDPPKNTCSVDTDCYRAQGEHCDMQKHACVATPRDAGAD